MSEEKKKNDCYKYAKTIFNITTTKENKTDINKSINKYTKDCLKCKNNGNYSSCHNAAKTNLYRSLPFIKNNIYPWKNYDWNYGNYIDNNYSPLRTGAKPKGSFSQMLTNIKALKKLGDGYLFDPNPGENSFAGIYKNGKKIDWNNNNKYELLNSDVPYYECNGQIMSGNGEVKNLSEEDKKLCRIIQNTKYSDESDPPYEDSFFKKNLNGRNSSSYYIKIGYCKKNISKEKCLRNGFKWISENNTCYKPRYGYINNESGLKFASTRMDGLLPSLGKDVMALSPDKINAIMNGESIKGYFNQQNCDDENFINYKKKTSSNLLIYKVIFFCLICYILFLIISLYIHS